MSESEPELGLGLVGAISARTVTVTFPSAGETREYVLENAPLRRVRFRLGDRLKTANRVFVVDTISERDGLLFYGGNGFEVCEEELSGASGPSGAEERLLSGRVDECQAFDLRVAALTHQHRIRRSSVRGFVGGRIDLIPHQLFIASEVASRMAPRVLLADEVGLGKTIEACLIVHRLLLTGRVQRALVLVPESLVHQWFVELLRRFNLWFHIFDEERCQAIEAADPEVNPFLDDQLVLCALDLFTGNARRLEQALAAGWDIVVVDEAHHLGWSPESPSSEYRIVEALGRQTPGLLLLTATPEQLGMASHFARLRLLDPDRYSDFEQFLRENNLFRDIARIAERLMSGAELAESERTLLGRILSEDDRFATSAFDSLSKRDRDELVERLLDRHGTGRVMFRNTRATVTGFPRRIARLCPLAPPAGAPEFFDRLADEFGADLDPAAWHIEPDFSKDPRISWLVELLRRLGSEKVLLICRSRRKAEAIESALRQAINVNMALFHEGLPLVQRDRNAAWFAEQEGARILICSEIGSEGRNFQFAHHLVLFDMPLDPELLEQRIGRLDRIGQTTEIQVHVPFVTGSPQEVLARWFHEGLNAFEKNLHGGRELLERFGSEVQDLAQDIHETADYAELERLIGETRAARDDLAKRLQEGRDRLLELKSFRPEASRQLVLEIRREDADRTLDLFLMSMFDQYSIHVEELADRTYQLGSAGVFADMFPGLPAEGLTVTYERARALSREDIQFLTWDHPLVTGALDLILGSELGNSSFGVWPDDRARGLYLQTVFVLECVAPLHLHIDRFLPPTPIQVAVDHVGADVTALVNAALAAGQVKNGNIQRLLEMSEWIESGLAGLLENARAIAEEQSEPTIARACDEMNSHLEHEISRLTELQKVNRNVRPDEIELLVQQRNTLRRYLDQAQLRLDAVRFIRRGSIAA